MLIVCEGEVTEVEYFEGITRLYRAPTVKVECVGKGRDPLKTVNHALRLRENSEKAARSKRDSFLKIDHVWCVVDVDDHTTLDGALRLAKRNDVHLIVSNPCFEIWLLWHYQDFASQTNRFDLPKKLDGHIPGYSKKKAIPTGFPFGEAEHSAAKKRALCCDPQHDAPCRQGRNPSSNVWLAVEAVRGEGRKP
ncbi:RloB domain-containing protein [Actinomadura harenae]|uniref:RloB domain-containing protein n=1 Tax=Actinomadura harenae TaxID=2483351 RepID=A0A3M2M525_9ACTN|nr:RloB domain-containing protein [Actinomadura harenae]